ncbi:hypothetical protein BGX28_007982 [Mortierella sp. GBA30]|nr:hypothetical protein BGX28_007982 [Mortierella sp. GBA30]
MPSSERSRSRSSFSSVASDYVPELRPLPQTYAPLACDDPSNAIPFDMSILTISHRKNVHTIKAIIVGGGIAGLALAIMMELAGIEYEILESHQGEQEKGAALALGPPVLRLLEQMGLLAQVVKASKEVSGMTVVDGECRTMSRIAAFEKERYGYAYHVLTRAAFHKILLDRVPKANLHQGKVVVETLQNSNGVSCKCSDGSTYYGDIIVGADGAQSLTRERMYMQLKEVGKLPEADMESSVYEHIAITGVTDELDPHLYPTIQDKSSEFRVIFTKEASHSLWYMPVPGNRVAWTVSGQLPKQKLRRHLYSHPNAAGQLQRRDPAQSTQPKQSAPSTQSTRPVLPHASSSSSSSSSSTTSSSAFSQHTFKDDWLAPAADLEELIPDFLNARCAVGVGSVRDFLRHTPVENIAHVDLEERLYKTWHNGRIVLVGDACHQHLLIGAQGTIQCLLDGVCLVNLLHDMEFSSPQEISKAFKKYHAKRSAVAKHSIDETNSVDKVFHSQGLVAGMMRKLIFNAVWSFSMANDKYNNNRPQLSFLPFVEDRGISKAHKQKISARLTKSQLGL